MEHLLYVLWHDHWKPWLIDKLVLAGYIAIALSAVATVIIGMIALEVEVSRILSAFYGG